jgi:hypothetical protein
MSILLATLAFFMFCAAPIFTLCAVVGVLSMGVPGLLLGAFTGVLMEIAYGS